MSLTVVQTTVTVTPAKGAPGMLYDDAPVQNVINKICQVAIPFGAFCKVTGQYCTLPASSADVLSPGRGIALWDPGKPGPQAGSTGGYQIGDIAAILMEGRVWIQLEASASQVLSYTAPYIRYTANTTPTRPVGGFTSSADSGKAVQAPGLHMFSDTDTSTGNGVLEIGPYSYGTQTTPG